MWLKKFLLYIFVILSLSNITFAQHENAFDILRQQFRIDHHINQAAVKKQIQWLQNHQGYINDLIESKPFIFYIINELKKRNLPGEIALIPMIESDYDPFVYSAIDASGIWQIMPETAKDLGLKLETLYDPRKNIEASTGAALKYLTYLNKYFHGDWLLSFAAYSSGEGRVSRLIKSQKHSNFWKLNLPQETKAYIPRLLALAEVIQNPQKYGLKLPYIPYAPYFEKVQVKSQIDLSQVAKLSGVPYKEIIKLNSGYKKWSTLPNQTANLLLPIDKIKTFKNNYASLDQTQRNKLASTKPGPIIHHVKKGETLKQIAQKYQTDLQKLAQLNPGIKAQLRHGQKISLG